MANNTAEAIAAQPFKSFDIKFPNGVRYSFERRGQEFKVLEGSPGKSRIYIGTVEVRVSQLGQDSGSLHFSQKEGEFKYPDLWTKAKAMFWLAYGKGESWS